MVSDEYGMKMEMFMEGKISQVMYMLPAEGLVVSLVPESKKYIRMELNDEQMLAKMRQESNDPRYMASEFMNSEYVELGIKDIDGVEVEGFEVTDPAAMGGMFETLNVKLWFDVVSGWPVEIEMDVTMAMGEKSMHMVMVMHDFEWDVEVDPEEFVPVIGDDYSELANMQMPKMDVNSAIEGLKMFADMAGRYPKKLNVMGIMGEMMEVKKDQGIEDGQALKAAREGMTEEEAKEQMEQYMEEKAQGMAQEMMPMMSAGGFHMRLVQEERDPVYYGETVMPGDGDSVLLRWRLDDGDYTVIYGDLREEVVSVDRLAELEGTISN